MDRAIAVYPGTFDPVTRGHLDVIERGLKVFGRLVVAVVNNPSKHPIFSTDERMEMLRESTQNMNGHIEVDSFNGLLADYMQIKKAKVVLRGLRAVSDFEFELEMALTNRHLNEEAETMFLTPSEKVIYLRASTVRQIAKLNGDVSAFVTPNVEKRLTEHYSKQ
ncbi:pantetheine-phosphate adenylyltransferase [bacterium]|nr:pantetheine-phosphate adenylyltransferase [bacterium]